MPLAFILVVMVSLLGGWYSTTVHNEQQEVKLTSEAQAIASNMLSYQKLINDYVRHLNDVDQVANYSRFLSFSGDAADYIAACDAAGYSPGTMSWFKGPMPGVIARIEYGKLYMYYQPNSTANATQRGVQAELLRLTRGSYGVGKSVQSGS